MTTETPTPNPRPTLWQRANTPLTGKGLRRAKIAFAVNAVVWLTAVAFTAGQLAGTLATIASLR